MRAHLFYISAFATTLMFILFFSKRTYCFVKDFLEAFLNANNMYYVLFTAKVRVAEIYNFSFHSNYTAYVVVLSILFGIVLSGTRVVKALI